MEYTYDARTPERYINLKFSEVQLKFPWERNANNITESRKFLYRNKTANLSTQTPKWISKHRILAISFEAVTSGGARIKAIGLRDKNALSQRVVRQTLLMFGYNTGIQPVRKAKC